MCLNPIHIKSKSKFFTLSSLQGYNLSVPCGECAECASLRQNEYYVRAYYQCLDCWSKGGYVLFDTLSYDDDHLPHIFDMLSDYTDLFSVSKSLDYSCFNYTDIRLFTVNLRRQLTYHGFDPKDNLKYFIVSEYGSDDYYVDRHNNVRQATKRPHYHVLFFVYEPSKLSPMELSEFIAKTWKNGRTDGYGYQTNNYIMNHVFMSCDELHARAVCNYVAKYLVKSTGENIELKDRFEKVFSCIFEIVYLDRIKLLEEFDFEYTLEELKQLLYAGDVKSQTLLHSFASKFSDPEKAKVYMDLVLATRKEMRLFRSALKRCVMPFTRQSRGFGLYMVDYLTPDYIFRNNNIKMPDADKVEKFLPVPQYIKSKMFKEVRVDEYGNEYMAWTDYGNEYRKFHALDSVNKHANRIVSYFDPQYLVSIGFAPFLAEKYHSKFNELLDGRTPVDFVLYQRYWKGRLFDRDLMDCSPDDLSFDALFEIASQDVHDFGLESPYFDDVFDIDSQSHYIEKYIVTDEFDSCFRDFDRIDSMLCVIYDCISDYKGECIDFKESLVEKLSAIYPSVKVS